MRRAGQNASINASLEVAECVPSLHPNREGDAKLEVNVIFTTYQGTLAALQAAASLARDLDTRIRFLVPQVVPFALPLDRPPVSVAFTKRRCCAMALACAGDCQVHVQIYLCRDKKAVLLRALLAGSVVVLGGKTSWLGGGDRKVARMLELSGHRVIFVDQNSMSPPWTPGESIL